MWDTSKDNEIRQKVLKSAKITGQKNRGMTVKMSEEEPIRNFWEEAGNKKAGVEAPALSSIQRCYDLMSFIWRSSARRSAEPVVPLH